MVETEKTPIDELVDLITKDNILEDHFYSSKKRGSDHLVEIYIDEHEDEIHRRLANVLLSWAVWVEQPRFAAQLDIQEVHTRQRYKAQNLFDLLGSYQFEPFPRSTQLAISPQGRISLIIRRNNVTYAYLIKQKKQPVCFEEELV